MCRAASCRFWVHVTHRTQLQPRPQGLPTVALRRSKCRQGATGFLVSSSAASAQAYCRYGAKGGTQGMGGPCRYSGVKCSCALPRAAPLHRLPTRSLATHSVATCSAKGKASVGSMKAMKLSKAKLTGVTVLDLSSGSECTAGSCSFLAAVECIPAGGKKCTAGGSKNVGTRNRGTKNFGGWIACMP